MIQMISRLMSLFVKKPITVEEYKVEEWFLNSKNELFMKINSELALIGEKLVIEKQKVERILDRIIKNKFKGDNYEFIELNKSKYTDKIRAYMNNLILPRATGINDFFVRYSKLREDLNNISHEILKDKYENELEEIDDHINKMDKIIQGIKNQGDIKNLKAIEKNIDDLKKSYNYIDILNKKLEEKKEEIFLYEKKGLKLQTEINQVQSSVAYLNYKNEQEQLKELKSNINIKETELLDKFENIKKIMNEYKKIAVDENIIGKYLENPLIALKQDMHLKIADEFDKINQYNKEGKFDYSIKIDKEYLSKFLNLYGQLLVKEKKLMESIENSIVNNQLIELLKESDQYHEKIFKIKKQIDDLKREIESVDRERIKELIQIHVKDVFNIKILIS